MSQPHKGRLKIKKTTWDLDQLFRSDDDPLIEKKRKILERKSYEFINKWKGRDDYLKNPAVLKNAIDEYENWKRHCGADGDEGYYFWLRTQQNQNDPLLKAKFSKSEEFSRKIENDIRFFSLNIAKIKPERQRKFLEYKGLKDYRHFLERIFSESRYMLSEPEEKILNLKTSTSYSNWVRLTSSFLAKEERKVVQESGERSLKNFSELLSLLNSKNKKARDSAADAFNDILKKHVEAAEAEINSILANKKVDDELRGVSRPDLLRHINDDIDSGIVDAVIQAVSGRFDISARYYSLKARTMKVRRLKYHERNVEYGEVSKRYAFKESLELVYRVIKKLDGKFAGILDDFIKNGRFDIYPRKGKTSGAFCVYHLISHPTYILLNHTNRLNDVLTLAHELGHGINNELIRERQNALNFGTPLSTAEVASTFMEDFVLGEILCNADDEMGFSIMMKKLGDDVSTIFRQVACYRFEQELHQEFRNRGYLSKEEIGKLFQKHMSSYMGGSVEQSDGSENWWVYWSHIRSFFYVYSYASGLLISKSLQKSVKKEPGFIDKVKEFLSAGMSDSPRNIFMRLGIDISKKEFWDNGLDEVETLLHDTEKLAVKLGKI
ncbi:MAG: M3 family oligoendopeptidase [Nitrospirota bacterium]